MQMAPTDVSGGDWLKRRSNIGRSVADVVGSDKPRNHLPMDIHIFVTIATKYIYISPVLPLILKTVH